MVLTNYYLRVTPFTNPDVADKLQLKPLKKNQPFRSTIQPFAFFFLLNFQQGESSKIRDLVVAREGDKCDFPGVMTRP